MTGFLARTGAGFKNTFHRESILRIPRSHAIRKQPQTRDLFDMQPIRPEAADDTAGLARKYRELCEKYDRLVHRYDELAAERLVITRISRAVSRSRRLALAVFQADTVMAANPAWRNLCNPSVAREWRSHVEPTRVFVSLDEAALLSAPEEHGSWRQLVRIADGQRVKLHLEEVEGADGRLLLAVAIDEQGAMVAVHRARNHLAAAMLQIRLLRDECDGAGAGRASTIAELLQLASSALEPGGSETKKTAP